MRIQQFLAPDAASLVLSPLLPPCSHPCASFPPATSLSLSGRVTYGCVACVAGPWDAGGMLAGRMPVGCRRDAGGMPAGCRQDAGRQGHTRQCVLLREVLLC